MSYRQLGLRFYWKMERWLVPGLRDSQYRYKEVLKSVIPHGASWLDLGCGHQIFPTYMSSSEGEEHEVVGRCRLAVGLDYSAEGLRRHRSLRARTLGDIERLPFAENTFDVVSANMVVEHVANPTAAVAEITRILRPGGIFLFHTVNFLNYTFFLAKFLPQRIKNRLIWLLEGRKDEDVFPVFYRFNTARQLKTLLRDGRLQCHRMEFLNSTATTAQLGPVAIPELGLIRLLQRPWAEHYRSNIIGVLKKADCNSAVEPEPVRSVGVHG
jgi:ubiquinone/menaquinone biosynthesis C-methylase UbiE